MHYWLYPVGIYTNDDEKDFEENSYIVNDSKHSFCYG